MTGRGSFQSAASIDLVTEFAGKVAAANSAPRHVWDRTLTQESTLDVGMPS